MIKNAQRNNQKETECQLFFTVLTPEDFSSLTVSSWLSSLHLERYSSSFASSGLFSSMDRVRNVWDDELVSILEVEAMGHRKRMLTSVAGLEGREGRFGRVKEGGSMGRHKKVVR